MYLSLSIFFLCFFVAVSNAERDFSFDNQALDSQSSTLPTLKGWLKANGVDMNQKIAAHRNGTKTATKSALRSVKPKDSTLLEGSLEIGYYGNEECEGPVLSKLIIPANGCFEDVDYYIKIILIKDGYAPGVDKLRVTYQKEEDCSDEGTYPVEFPVRYHKCYNKGTRAVYRPTLPTPAEVDLPVFIATYQGNNACYRNDGQTGLREVVYFRKNFCVRGYGGDKFIAGCDTKGRLVMTYYPSRDGTCRNVEGRDESYTDRTIQNGEDCLDDFYLSDFGLVGFKNFRCRK